MGLLYLYPLSVNMPRNGTGNSNFNFLMLQFIQSDSILREEYPKRTYTDTIQAIQEDNSDKIS